MWSEDIEQQQYKNYPRSALKTVAGRTHLCDASTLPESRRVVRPCCCRREYTADVAVRRSSNRDRHGTLTALAISWKMDIVSLRVDFVAPTHLIRRVSSVLST